MHAVLRHPDATTPRSYVDAGSGALLIAGGTPSVPVGLLRCQADPLATKLKTTVYSAKKVPAPAPSKSKKDSSLPTDGTDKHELWHVLLENTVLFPEGGGQPSDTGTLYLPDRNLCLDVVSAFRRNLDAVHVVSVPPSESEVAAEALRPGAPATIRIDWARREDHMQQHTGQHLLSAMLDGLNPPIPTLSWALTAWPQPCYVELPRAPTEQELRGVERQMQMLIDSDRSITTKVDAMDEEAARKAPKLPQDYGVAAGPGDGNVNDQGVIRTVSIEGVDTNPCCGTHWPSLRFLQYAHILPGYSKVRGTNVRLSFAFGRRAYHNLHESFDVAASVSRTLDCGRAEVQDRLEQLMLKEKASRKRETRLREEAAVELAAAVLHEALGLAAQKQAPGPLAFLQRRRQELDGAYTLQSRSVQREDGKRLAAIALHRADADLELLTAVAREVDNALKEGADSEQLPAALLLCLSSGATVPATTLAMSSATESLLLVACERPAAGTAADATAAAPAAAAAGGKKKGGAGGKAGEPASLADKLVAHAGDGLRTALGDRLKGGGKGKWQGKLAVPAGAAPGTEPRWEKDDAAKRFAALTAAIESVPLV